MKNNKLWSLKKMSKERSKYADLIDSGGKLLHDLFNLGLNLGWAQGFISHKIADAPAPPDSDYSSAVMLSVTDKLVDKIEKECPDILDLPEEDRDRILDVSLKQIIAELEKELDEKQ